MRISKNVAVIEKLQGYELLIWNPKTKKTTRIKISENGLNKKGEIDKNDNNNSKYYWRLKN